MPIEMSGYFKFEGIIYPPGKSSVRARPIEIWGQNAREETTLHASRPSARLHPIHRMCNICKCGGSASSRQHWLRRAISNGLGTVLPRSFGGVYLREDDASCRRHDAGGLE